MSVMNDLMQLTEHKPHPISNLTTTHQSSVLLAEKHITVLPHPPYSNNLAPCNFFIFPKMNNGLKAHHFGSVDNIQRATTQSLNTIPLDDFQGCDKNKKNRCEHCAHSQGAYFEGDNV
uniref:Histone-lysine N-methyltransferase SETMAR n=1 Tax=Cyprinus carpio TaxID=7962 RepID=A0A8C2BRK8_CYPCA